MMYKTNVYIQGNSVGCNETEDEDDAYKFIESKYGEIVGDLEKKGYVSVHSDSQGYAVMFSKAEMKSACISYTIQRVTDFLDVNGKAIVLEEPLVSVPTEESGDKEVYAIYKSPSGDSFYLRSLSHHTRQTIWKGERFVGWTRVISDKNNLTQDDLDKRKLRIERT